LEHSTVGDAFDRVALGAGERLALVFAGGGPRWSYRETLAHVQRAAKGLIGLGVDLGDRVAVWATNRPAWVVLQLATAKVGAVLVPIRASAAADEVAYVLAQCGASTLFLVDRADDVDRVAALTAVCPELPGARPGRIVSKRFPRLKRVASTDEHAVAGAFAWPQVLAASAGISDHLLRRRQESVDPDDSAAIQYTAGATGAPKGAVLTHVAATTTARYVGECMRLGSRDRVCLPVAFDAQLGWLFGTLTTIAHGATLVVPSERFDPGATLAAIAAERCTAVHGTPATFRSLLAHRQFHDFDLASLRTGVVAGAPCPGDLMQQIVRRMHAREITVAYGPAEACGAITQTRTEDPLELRATTVGRALPEVDLRVVDAAGGRDAAPGAVGELCCRGYPVMRGYHELPEATAAAIDANGWLHTGDLAIMDEHGYCRIVGRREETIVRDGEAVQPREVETLLASHPKVHDAAVFGVPDVVLGEEIAAWIRLRDGETASVAEIRDFCRGRATPSRVPRYVRFVDDYPRAATGKVQRFRMREIMIDELKLRAAR
jgi:fatty-acyl-CoA synthase